MKHRTISIFLFYFYATFSTITAYAQDKRPEAIPDFYTVVADVVFPLKPLINDIVDVGHTARIFQVSVTNTGVLAFNDSTIFYNINAGFKGIDTIRYRIRDNQNGLISDFATITLNVRNYAYDTLNINNISALINPFGTLFFNLYNQESPPHFEFPKGSGLHTMFNMTLNLYGHSSSGGEFLSGAKYQAFGRDFFSGPVSNQEVYGIEYDSTWKKVWKLDKNEIDHHKLNFGTEGYNMPVNIKFWPANGNQDLGQAAVLAPYHDYNENGIYDPGNGDYPLIRGDQAIYFIYNDIRSAHTEYNGQGMGAEIHCMVYAFNRPDVEALHNNLFVNYMVYNRGQHTLDELKISVFADADLGYWGDDYSGCDAPLNMGFIYNGDDYDEIQGGGYGNHPPAQSVMLLNRNLAGFRLFGDNLDFTSYAPFSKQDLLNVMNGLWSDGEPIIGNGCGHPSCAQGDTVTFAYSGDPSIAGTWSELQQGNQPGDRSMMLNVEPVYDFRPGDAVCIDLALTTARDMNGNHIDSFVLLKEYAAQVQEFYNENFPASCFDVAPGFEEKGTQTASLKIYPVPANDYLMVELPSGTKTTTGEYLISDLTGRTIKSAKISSAVVSIDVSQLQPGMYFLTIQSGNKKLSAKFIKQ